MREGSRRQAPAVQAPDVCPLMSLADAPWAVGSNAVLNVKSLPRRECERLPTCADDMRQAQELACSGGAGDLVRLAVVLQSAADRAVACAEARYARE